LRFRFAGFLNPELNFNAPIAALPGARLWRQSWYKSLKKK
jgi:hypothetical protein